MKRRYQIDREKAVRRFREDAERDDREIQLHLPLKEVAAALQEGVGELMRQAGLEMMQLIMEDEVRRLAGERCQRRQDEQGYRWGKPDGNVNDEDLEHVQVIVDPGRPAAPGEPPQSYQPGHTNQVFALGPDNGPEARIFAGEPNGVVLWRNELTRIFLPERPETSGVAALPADQLGRKDANGDEFVAERPHFEETFSAGFANSVDNYRALPPLRPTTYRYEVKLPKPEELELLGVELEGPLHVRAQVNFLHFPPLFLRFLTRTTSAKGPAGHDFNLVDEKLMDDLLVNVKDIANAETMVNLVN